MRGGYDRAMNAAALRAWIASLTVEGGDLDGEPWRVLGWQSRFLGGLARAEGDVALSVARGNGKSALLAAVASGVVAPSGPLHARRAEVVIVSGSYQQASIIADDAIRYVAQKHDLTPREWRRQQTLNVSLLEHRPSGARLRCVASRPQGLHGLRAGWLLLDEPDSWERGQRDRAWSAIRTGQGKFPGRLVALGTSSADRGHWFTRLLDGEAEYVQLHQADAAADPFAWASVRRANPSLPHLRRLAATLKRERRKARIDPLALASWRSLRLNLPTSDTPSANVLTAEDWERAEGLGPADARGERSWGIDAGGSVAMSAIACYWPATGKLSTLAAFGDEPDLLQRGRADAVGPTYALEADAGELITTPGRVADLGVLIREAAARWGPPQAVSYDRYRAAEVLDALDRAGIPPCPTFERPAGFAGGGEDLRSFRRCTLRGDVAPDVQLSTRTAFSEAVVVADSSGNLKLAKGGEGGRRPRHRDDIVAAAILAVSTADLRSEHPLPTRQSDAA